MTTKPDSALVEARLIATQIATTDGRTPLERVLARHWPTVTAWRSAGWTWRQIAALLTRGGVRLKAGTPVTDKYLAAVASRIGSQKPSTTWGQPTVRRSLAVSADDGMPLSPVGFRTSPGRIKLTQTGLAPQQVMGEEVDPANERPSKDDHRSEIRRRMVKSRAYRNE